jgi:hypothetical protein
MSAAAILNILVGLAVGGWIIYGGVAEKLADAVTGGDDSSTDNIVQMAPVRPQSKPVFV